MYRKKMIKILLVILCVIAVAIVAVVLSSDAVVRAFAAWRTVGTYQAVAEFQGRGVP